MKKLHFSKEHLGEALFFISYFFIFIGIFRIFRSFIYNGDAFRIGLILHLMGVFLGGTRFGGKGILTLFHPLLKSSSLQIFIYFLWSSLWGGVALIRHYGLHTGDFDVGIFGQTLFSISHGRGYLQFPDIPWSYLGVHQNFTLPLFTPFFWTDFGTELLLFTQPFFLFSPAVFFGFWIKKKLDENHEPYSIYWSWITFYLFLSASTLTRNTLWEWHETVITYPALCLWMWALCFQKTRTFILAGLVAGLTKENILISLIPGILIYPWVHFYHKNRDLKKIILFTALAFLHLFIFAMERHFFSEMNFSSLRYDWLGHSEKEILKTLIFKPSIWINEVFSEKRFGFIKALLETSGIVGLFSGPFVLTWVIPLMTHVLSNREAQYLIHYHYALEIWPLMAVSSIFVWLWVLKKWPEYRQAWIIFCFCVVVFPVSESVWDRFQEHLPDFQNNHVVIKKMRADLLDLKKENPSGLRGMSSQWTFAHFFQDVDPLYPVQTLEELKIKKGFEDSFILAINKECLFILGEQKDYDLVIPSLKHSFIERNIYEVSAWGNKIQYKLWVARCSH